MARNVDKLLSDAHRSRLVGLGEFLEYIQTLRDVGLREGEAPVEAGGAVQLMTVHKSKGLEFPVVVIADAAYEPRAPAAGALFDPELGLLPGLKDEEDDRPLTWRLAYMKEADKDDAEDRRLLYVAATRAREKLLVSGHAKIARSGKLSMRGWLGDLGKVLGMDEMSLAGELQEKRELTAALPEGSEPIAWILYPPAAPLVSVAPLVERSPEAGSAPGDLLAPLAAPSPETSEPIRPDDRLRARHSDPPDRVWRVVPKARRPSGPAWVVGRLVHEALRRWRFPGPGFDEFLRSYALESGLADEDEIRATVSEARRLLERLRLHPLYAEIEASERYHDIPYVLSDRQGILDLLYLHPGGWVVVDFKTDEARSEVEMREIVRREGYDQQVRRSAEAVAAWLGCRPQARLVFLRVEGEVKVIEY
jgi:ATP-dependent exoDNAse (exonuclease V) beta subunit